MVSLCRRTALRAAVVLACAPAGYTHGARDVEGRVQELLAAADTSAAIDLLEHTNLEALPSPRMMVTLGMLYRAQGTIVDRLKSQKVLERARELYPGDADVRLELGMTYFAQTFYPDAARELRECIALDPDNCGAMYKLGVTRYERWKVHVHAWRDDAREACEWFSAALACDSTNVDAARRLAAAYYGLESLERARDCATALATRYEDEWYFPMIVGSVAFTHGDMAAADSAFAHGLDLMKDSERAAFTAIGRNTLGYDDLDVYDALPPQEKEAMNRGFWVNSDPDPTTVLNERALEHMHRTFKADVLFSASKPHIAWTRPQTRGWDTERGETLIKFGWPDAMISAKSAGRWERWLYQTDDVEPAEFAFVDRWLNGMYQIPSRSDNLSYIRHADRGTRYVPDWRELDGAMDITAFREDNFIATLYACVDVGGAGLETSPGENFNARLRLFGDDWEAEAAAERVLESWQLARMPASEHTYYGYVQRCDVDFARYHVAAAFEDCERRFHALFRSGTNTTRFVGDGVQLSDILLERESKAGPTIQRGGFTLRPNPWAAYAPGQPLRTYVEIYNLAMRSGATQYVLSYSIQESPTEPPTAWNRLGRLAGSLVGRDGPPVVRHSSERSGASRTDTAPLAIDVDALPPGRYTVTIRVDDQIGRTSAEISEPFHKVAPPPAPGR